MKKLLLILSHSLPGHPARRIVQMGVIQAGLFLISYLEGSAQNVGIGITTPTRAKFEVFGVAGAGATSAIFGSDATGISLQRNWPTIGFNQYRDIVVPGSQGKYMANGFAAIQYFDPTTGAMAFDMFSNGIANTFTPAANRAITIRSSGNVGIRSWGSNTASLYVTKETNFDGAAIFGGTQHGSYFCYSTAENTYIRGGKNGSSVYINDIPNGNILLGGGSSKIGINEFNPLTSLQVNGAMAVSQSAVTVTPSSPVIEIGNKSYIIVTKNPANDVFIYLSNGLVPGQLLILESAVSNGSTGFKLWRGNIKISEISHTLKATDTIMLLWNGSYWLEVSVSHNYY